MVKKENTQKITKFTPKTPDEYARDLKLDLMKNIGEAQAIVLLRPTPKAEIKKLTMGSMTFDYVEHAYVSELLDTALLMDWDLIVTHQERVDNEALVHGYIEARFKNGTTIKRYGSGGAVKQPTNRNQTWADVFKASTSDLLKNCAARMGVARDLYRDDKIIEARERAASQSPSSYVGVGTEPATVAQRQEMIELGYDIQVGLTREQADKLLKDNLSTTDE